jgi:hypothetical protein
MKEWRQQLNSSTAFKHLAAFQPAAVHAAPIAGPSCSSALVISKMVTLLNV